ncbi:tyrosine- phosphatase Lar isoform X3, partial [Paramuricea clavata]
VVPGKPTNLIATNIKSRSAEISWRDPENHGINGFSRFRIKLKKENFLILNITIGRVNEYEINNLTPYTAYEIFIAAGNNHGFGEEGNTSFLTSEEAPSGPPLNIRTTSRSASSLSFAWDPPEETKRNGIIIGYRACVSLFKNYPCFKHIHIFVASQRTWLVVNLNPLTKYYVHVLASTTAGQGNYSKSKGFFTGGNKPTNLTVTKITSRSAAISWQDPEDHGINGLSRFRIKLKKENSLILNITKGRVNEYAINNLTPYTTYEIFVAAGNDYYQFGEETMEPDKPRNFTVAKITSRSAEISWQDPKYHGINGVSRFRIKLKKENSLILNITIGRVNGYEINNLTPYTAYEISVAAGNDYGFGEESNTSFFTSEEAPSGPPLNIRTTSRSASSLFFAWDPPEETKRNGIIIGYRACVSLFKNYRCFKHIHILVASQRQWLVVNLNPLTKYYVHVLASTTAGHGNYSESKGFFTDGNKPTNLTVTKITSRSAEVSWLHLEDRGLTGVSRFRIKLKKENSLILNITIGKVNKYEINNLTPYTTYEITVAAGNDYYLFGGESNTSFLTSEEAPSGPPLNIRTTSRSASSLSPTWDLPEKTKQNGVIISYTACVSHLENDACFQTFTTSERTWLIGNLNSSTKYYVRILASTKAGHGNYSECEGFFTNGPAEKATAKTSRTLTFSLKIPSKTFVYFYVVALKLKDGKGPASSDNYENNELVTYAQAGNLSNPKPYIAAVVTSSGVDGDSFILGDGRNTDDPTSQKRRSTASDYFNGPLEPSTSYSVFRRIIINEMGDYYSTDWSPPSKTSEDQVPGDVSDTDDNSKKYLVGVIVVVVILVVFIALYFICQNYRRKASSTEEKTNDRGNSQDIYDDVVIHEQEDDEQSPYTDLNRPGDPTDDHLYAHLNEVTQNVCADQEETEV